jgi:hypothetical protein
MWKCRRNKGYILMETCLAIFFLTAGMVMVVRAMANSLRAIRFSQNYLLAGYLLEEKIGEDRLTGSVQNGSRDIFSWSIDKKVIEELEERTVTISWLEKDRPNSQSFSYTLP